jgi:hypothetical protein
VLGPLVERERQRHAGERRALRGDGGLAPARRLARGEVEQRPEEVDRAADPLAVRLPGVGLEQHAEPVPPAPVAVREVRARLAVPEARGGVLVVGERRVEVERQVPARGEAPDDRRVERERGRAERRRAVSAGPRWLGRWFGPNRSLPSTFRTGTNTTVTRASGPARPAASHSRSAMKPASLPSISPAWMPPWNKIVSRRRARAAAGSSAPSALTASASMGRPSGVVPNVVQRARPGKARSNARQSRSTSA